MKKKNQYKNQNIENNAISKFQGSYFAIFTMCICKSQCISRQGELHIWYYENDGMSKNQYQSFKILREMTIFWISEVPS